jgi:hypothetical protein
MRAAGPQMDIVVPAQRAGDATLSQDTTKVGFLATSVTEFAECIVEVATMPEELRQSIAKNGRARVTAFSAAAFEHAFLAGMSSL